MDLAIEFELVLALNKKKSKSGYFLMLLRIIGEKKC